MTTLIITGGAGFIGSELVGQLLDSGHKVVVVDALTYSGRIENIATYRNSSTFEFCEGSIYDAPLINSLIEIHKPKAIFNLAAETHVDRSIDLPNEFIITNIIGTHTVLGESLAYWNKLPDKDKHSFRFIQVSTDEVYGSNEDGFATEEAPFKPNSPYAASKAAGDHLVRAYQQTYHLPTIVTHGCNTFGPRQHPEKFIPRLILRGLTGQTLPVYGDGSNIREWISVKDHANGIISAWKNGSPGQAYNLGSGTELANIEVAKLLCKAMDLNENSAIKFVEDRPGHDRRYAMDCSKSQMELKWNPNTNFALLLNLMVDWYRDNPDWWQPITQLEYKLDRLGMGKVSNP